MGKVIDTVAWVMDEDKVLKLDEVGVKDIADNVVEYLKKTDSYGEKLVGKKVEVEIDDKQGQDGTIIHLKVVDGKEPEKNIEEKVKKEEPKAVDSGLTVKELTVAGVSVQYKGVSFKEEKDVWYTLDSTIDVNKFKDECTKKTVEVTIAPQEKGNDIIKGYVVKVVDEPKAETEVKERKSNYTTDVQKSIEAQASVNSANEVVSQMKDILLDPAKVLTTITAIANHNFKLIQELKSRQE